jgi:hypothetical protein
MAKWGEIKCPRCAAPPIALWDALARQLEESDAREARLNDKISMLEEHLCLAEEKLERAMEMLRVLGIADAILAELKGQGDE